MTAQGRFEEALSDLLASWREGFPKEAQEALRSAHAACVEEARELERRSCIIAAVDDGNDAFKRGVEFAQQKSTPEEVTLVALIRRIQDEYERGLREGAEREREECASLCEKLRGHDLIPRAGGARNREKRNMLRESLKIALYGDWETGKTDQIKHLIHGWRPENVSIISADGGLNSIASHLSGVHVERVGTWKELKAAYGRLRELKRMETGQWIVLDGASRTLNWIENENKRLSELVYEKVTANAKIESEVVKFKTCVTQNDRYDVQKVYGFIGRDIEDFISAFIRLPCNLYFNFLEALAGTNGRERCKPYGPQIPGRVGMESVMNSFDFIFRIYWSEGKQYVRTAPTDEYMARRRNDIDGGELIEPVIENFNLAAFAESMGAKPQEAPNAVGPEV